MAGKKDAAWWRDYRARRKLDNARAEFREKTAHLTEQQVAERVKAIVTEVRAKPSFLAAPDDDCATCGHDRHEFHLAACTFRTGVDGRGKPRYCGCSKWQEAVLF